MNVLRKEVDVRVNVHAHPVYETSGRYQELYTMLGLSYLQNMSLLSWLAPAIATVDRWSATISLGIIAVKLYHSVLFVMGERSSAKLMLFYFALRQIVNYNLFAAVNQPPRTFHANVRGSLDDIDTSRNLVGSLDELNTLRKFHGAARYR